MTAATDALKAAFRKYVVNGIPGTGYNEPSKDEIRSAFELLSIEITGIATGLTGYATVTAMNAAVSPPASALAYVYLNNGSASDPANGFYQRNTGNTAWITSAWLNSLYLPILAASSDRTSANKAATPVGVESAIHDRMVRAASPAGRSVSFAVRDPVSGKVVPVVENDHVVSDDASLARVYQYRADTWVDGPDRYLWRFDDAACLIHVHMGQSNAVNPVTDPADSIVNGSSVYSQSMMLAGTSGPRRWGQRRTTTLVPLVEVAAADGRGTLAAGFANHLIRDMFTATGKYLNIISMVVGLGGRRYEGLCRGQPVYQAILDNVSDAVEAGRAQGFARFVTILSWDQGEGNADDTNAKYAARLKQFARQLPADIMAITAEREKPPIYVFQVNNANGWEHGPRFAAVDTHGEDGLRLVGPRFQFAYYDTIHLLSVSQSYKGQYLSRAVREEMFGAGHRPMRPIEAWWQTTSQIKVRIDLPYGATAVVNDTSGTFVSTTGLANSGFVFDDGSGSAPAISSVAVADDIVTINLATAPTGPRKRLGYALFRNAGAGDQDGNLVGARGTIRGNAAHTSLIGPNQYDWLCAFKLDL